MFSFAIKHNYIIDVAVFSTNGTNDVALQGNCYIINNLSVLGTSAFGNTLNLKITRWRISKKYKYYRWK